MKTIGEKKLTPGLFLLAIPYFLLATAMYYFHEQTIYLGVHVLYKMVFAVLIAGLSFVVFLMKTDLGRAKNLGKYFMLLILPHLVVLLVTVPLWVFRMSPMEVIRRGAFAQIYCIAIILAGTGILYVFGKKGLWLNLFAMLAANLITIAGAIRQTGLGEYLKEFFALVRSFGKENGAGISAAEINELTFALGLYLLFLLLEWKTLRKTKIFFPMLVLTAFCYFSGFKRIGAFAVLLCLAASLLLSALTAGKERRKGWLLFFSAAVVLVAFLYLVVVREGLFDFLEKHFDLNTMGRKTLNSLVGQYYKIAPDYLGQGAGFVSRLFSNELIGTSTVRALHNDILALYIDIGFWGFWLWMTVFMPLRVMFVSKWQSVRGGIVCACLCLFVLVTAFTDNTIYYVYVIGTVSLLTMSGSYREPVPGKGGAG